MIVPPTDSLVALLPVSLAAAILSGIALASPKRYGVYFSSLPLVNTELRLRVFFSLVLAGAAYQFIEAVVVQWRVISQWSRSTFLFSALIFGIILSFSMIFHRILQRGSVARTRNWQAGIQTKSRFGIKTLIPIFVLLILGGSVIIRIWTSPALREEFAALQLAPIGSKLGAARATFEARGYQCTAGTGRRDIERYVGYTICGRYEQAPAIFAKQGIEIEMYGADDTISHIHARVCSGFEPTQACKMTTRE